MGERVSCQVESNSYDHGESSYIPQTNSSKNLNFRTLVNAEHVESHDLIVLPKSAIDNVKNKHDNSLVGYFLGGKSLPSPTVQNYVNMAWAKFGFQNVMSNDDGLYLFKFAFKTGAEQVLERGPWIIGSTPIILYKWSPYLSLKKDEVTKVPVWVKFHRVPLVAYSEDGLSLIATQIGKPIMLDSFTTSMCVESWLPISFARALVEISSDTQLKQEVFIAIPVEEGTGYTKETIRVEYEWKPPHCVDCKIFGHAHDHCVNRRRNTADQGAHILNVKVIGQYGELVFSRIRRNTQMKKLMHAYCDRQSVELDSIVFLLYGRLLRGEQTPDELQMEDGDEIDAMLRQP